MVATLDDYRVAQSLLADPLGRLLGRRVSDGALRFLARLTEWFGTDQYTLPEAKRREQHSTSGVYSWNSELVDAGFVEVAEAKRGKTAARYVVVTRADEAAEAVSVLPTADELENTT